jgi:chemotaxis protein methyltransferase WspC
VIFCRNLLIYLEEAASQHLLASLAGLMKVGGLLIVGSAETGKVPPELFEAIREPFVFGYRRRDAEASPPLLPAAIPSANPSSASPQPPAERERISAASQARQSRPRRSPSPRLQQPSPSGAARRPRVAPAGRERLGASSTPAVAAPTELERVEQELARNPYSDAAYLQLALWMLGQNRPQEALESLQKCLYLKPDSREALQAMIQLTRQLGQVERSRQFQGRLARLEP